MKRKDKLKASEVLEDYASGAESGDWGCWSQDEIVEIRRLATVLKKEANKKKKVKYNKMTSSPPANLVHPEMLEERR